MKKTYVLDTNVLIQAPYAFQCFEDNDIVLPVAVLEELDGLKHSDGERGANAGRPFACWNCCARAAICSKASPSLPAERCGWK